MRPEAHQRSRPRSAWGLRRPPVDAPPARRAERLWRWPLVALLLGTVPAFYSEIVQTKPSPLVLAAYLVAALGVGLALVHTAVLSGDPARHARANGLDIALVIGLIAAAVLPPSSSSGLWLAFRLGVAFLTMVRMVWATQHLFTLGSLAYVLLLAGVVLVLCGVGYWWLEPTTPTFGEALWLAFVTAGTVGYGDVVPTTPASRVFTLFVVMLGFGVLSLITAAIATKWVGAEERTIEREIIRDLHRQIDSLRHEIAAMRAELRGLGLVERTPRGRWDED